MYNNLIWKRSKSDMCSILTSGVYEIVQGYEGGYQLNKNDRHNCTCKTQTECKEIAEWDNIHN